MLELLPTNFECGKNDHRPTGEFITGSPNDPGNYDLKLHFSIVGKNQADARIEPN